jgi:hypothetical protein
VGGHGASLHPIRPPDNPLSRARVAHALRRGRGSRKEEVA